LTFPGSIINIDRENRRKQKKKNRKKNNRKKKEKKVFERLSKVKREDGGMERRKMI